MGPTPDAPDAVPSGYARLGALPHAHGNLLVRSLSLPDVDHRAVEVAERDAAEPTRGLGTWPPD